MVEGKTDVLMGKKLIFDHCAIFSMSLYAPCMRHDNLHHVIHFQTPLNQVADLREVTN